MCFELKQGIMFITTPLTDASTQACTHSKEHDVSVVCTAGDLGKSAPCVQHLGCTMLAVCLWPGRQPGETCLVATAGCLCVAMTTSCTTLTTLLPGDALLCQRHRDKEGDDYASTRSTIDWRRSWPSRSRAIACDSPAKTCLHATAGRPPAHVAV